MTTIQNVSPGLRLAPIDEPPGLLQRIARWYFRRQLGKVMTPLRVIYPRVPALFRAMLGMYRFERSGMILPPTVKHLVELRTSRNHGCDFCGDLHHAMALDAGLDPAQIDALSEHESSPLFDESTRAALRYVDEMDAGWNVSDATFEALRRHYDERQIVELVWLYAFVTYTNLMAKPLGMTSDGFCAAPTRSG